jgi:hypothetical protein
LKLAPLAVCVAVACAASAPRAHYTQSQVACTSDDDCAVSNVQTCCPVCPEEPYADVKGVVAMNEQQCKDARCSPSPPHSCPKQVALSSLRAVCVQYSCVVAPALAKPAPTQTAAPVVAPAGCKTNDDCAMSTSRSCCEPCGLPPFADLKTAVDTVRNKCAQVECAMRVPQECKPTESVDAYHAECKNEACVAVRNPPPTVTPAAPATLASNEACTRDGDCVVSNWGNCCSSCQASAYATSKSALEGRNRRCAIVDCAIDQLERCEPIVNASLYRAVCRASTCAGVKR